MNQHISVHDAFRLSQPIYQTQGIEGYRIHKTYVDPNKLIQQRQMSNIKKGGKPRRRATKKGSFLQDELKLRKLAPGPGKYPLADLWPQKRKLKSKHSERYTLFHEIMKQQKKLKIPAPGQYNVFKSLKEQEEEAKLMAVRKVAGQDRKTFLDSVQFDGQQRAPGVGNYNVRGRSMTETSFCKARTKPEDWRKRHTEEDKKKPAKIPTATSYSPKPSDYNLFQTMGKAKSKNGFGKMVRFKTSPSGPGLLTKYSVLQEWRGKEKKKLDRHGFEVLSRSRAHTSVYHD